ncbi:HEPN domain-containing protein, partial [Vibrio sp. 10N.261.48.A2]
SNINNSDRIINQQSLKNRIKYLMEELQLTSYYKREENSINKVINTRNKIVHNGWDRDLDEPIWDMIVTMRNTNYLLVISKLNYQGSFWFCFKNEKQTLEMNR